MQQLAHHALLLESRPLEKGELLLIHRAFQGQDKQTIGPQQSHLLSNILVKFQLPASFFLHGR